VLEEMRSKQSSILLGSMVLVSAIFVSVAVSYHLAMAGIKSSSNFHQETLEERHAFINRTIDSLVTDLISELSVFKTELASAKTSLQSTRSHQTISDGKLRNLAKKVKNQKKDNVAERNVLQETLTDHIETNSNSLNSRIDELYKTVRMEVLDLQADTNGTEDELSGIKENISIEKKRIDKVKLQADANAESMDDIIDKMMNDREAVKNITEMYKKVVLTSTIIFNTNLTNGTDLEDMIDDLQQTMKAVEDNNLKEAFKDYNKTIQSILNQQVGNQNKSIGTVKDAIKKVYEGMRSFMYKSLGYVELADAGLYHVWNIQSKPFSEAKTHCETILGHLVEFKDKNEEDILLEHMREAFDDTFTFWVGARDEATEEKFVWETSGIELTYFNWYDGEPNNAGSGEDCVEVSNFQKWNDLDCDEYRMFVCEFDTKYDIDILI